MARAIHEMIGSLEGPSPRNLVETLMKQLPLQA